MANPKYEDLKSKFEYSLKLAVKRYLRNCKRVDRDACIEYQAKLNLLEELKDNLHG